MKNKKIYIFVIILIVISLYYPKIYAIVTGDVNQDGNVNILDAKMITKYVVGNISLNNDEKVLADYNNDSNVKMDDVVNVLKQINGKKIIDNLTYYFQGDYRDVLFCSTGYNVSNNGCGITSLSMIASTLVNPDYDPEYLANTICDYGPSCCGYGGMKYTVLWDEEFLNMIGLTSETLFFHDSGGSINGNFGTTYKSEEGEAILNAVNQGKPVVLLMPNHYVALSQHTSCTNEQVYLYDPDNSSKTGKCYTPKELYNVTYTNGSSCSNYGWCGWHLAVAFSKK